MPLPIANLRFLMMLLLAGGGISVLGSSLVAETHQQRARLRCGLPRQNFEVPHEGRVSVSLTTLEVIEEQVILAENRVRFKPEYVQEGFPWAGNAPAASSSVLSRPGLVATLPAATTTSAEGTVNRSPGLVSAFPRQVAAHPSRQGGPPDVRSILVRRKRFVLAEPSLVAGPVLLKDTGFVIYETGQVECTGRLLHDGGPFGSLLGSNIITTVRAFGGTAAPLQAIDGPAYFTSSRALWVKRGDLEHADLISVRGSEEIRRHFDEIVKLEINVKVQQSR